MATKKKNNSRKALAVALGIMGIAGLSLASASQLTVNTSSEVGAGVKAFGDNCQGSTPVTVSYAYATNALAGTTGYGITTVTVSGIATACNAKLITLGLTNATGATLYTSPATAIAGTTATVTATASNIDLATDLGNAVVIING